MSLTPLPTDGIQTAAANLAAIRLIATDMDGTLTQRGKFTAALLKAFEKLADSSLPLLIITGRSAGWVQALKHYLPITGAIAENGGIFYPTNSDVPEILVPINDVHQHRQQLSQMFQQLQTELPHLTESDDNRFRLTDWTFDITDLTLPQLETMEKICGEQKWGFTYSTVQCHIKPLLQNKAAGLLQVISKYFPQFTLEEIVTVGDSPNDETLFDAKKFPVSVGVANILHYTQQLKHLPTYVTTLPEAEGFCEFVQLLLP